jgi:peptide/nickel transport system substrate-binding protein
MEAALAASTQGVKELYDLNACLWPKDTFWYFDDPASSALYNQKNPAKAKQLLKEAGYNGEPVVFVTNTSYDYMYKAAQVIQEQLKKIGMNVTLGVYDWPGSLAVRKDMTKWDLFTSSHSTRFDPSANDFYFRAKTTFFGYNNPKMETLLDKASAATKFEDRYKIYEEVQNYLRGRALELCDHYTWQGTSEAQATPVGHGAALERVAGEVERQYGSAGRR